MRLLTSSSSTDSASIVVTPGTIGFASSDLCTLAVDGFRIGILGRAIKKLPANYRLKYIEG